MEKTAITGRIEAKYYMEPHASILIEVKNPTKDIEVIVHGISLPINKFDNFQVTDTYKTNIIQIGRINPITKDFQFRFDLKITSGEEIGLKGIFISSAENIYKEIPIVLE